MGLLDGKVVIVTGGGHGIGKAYCRGIAREGGVAVAADIDEKAAHNAANAIQDSGGKALGIHVDVANFASCQTMAETTLQAFGKIDGLVNNAAIFLSVPAEKGSWQEITESLGSHYGGQRQRALALQPCRGAGHARTKTRKHSQYFLEHGVQRRTHNDALRGF